MKKKHYHRSRMQGPKRKFTHQEESKDWNESFSVEKEKSNVEK